MRWTRSRTRQTLLGTGLLLLSCTLLLSVADSQLQFTVYAPQKTYGVGVQNHEGQLYLGLLDLMAPLGSASIQSKGKEWRLTFNGSDAVFTEGSADVKIRGRSVNLGGKARADNNTLLVPLRASFPLVSTLLRVQVELHPDGRRLFIDNAATHFTAELKKSERPSLLLNFDRPVNPVVSQDDTKIRLTFRHDPVVSDLSNQPWDDKSIRSLAFSEDNGVAFLTIAGAPGLNASVASDGRSIVIQSPPPPAAVTSAPASPSPSPPAPAMPVPTADQDVDIPLPQSPPGNQIRTGPSFFVMIDAAHGGDDQGARLSSRLAEKDITLSLARKIKAALQEKGIVARLTRDADVSLTLQQRAEAANEQRAGAYLAVHAGTPGGGVRVYVPEFAANGATGSGKFLTWESAQDNYLPRSRALARGIAGELEKKDLTVSTLGTPLRPLNNINAPAIAIELAADPDNVQDLTDQRFQTAVATAVAVSIARLRDQLEGQQ